jgi:acyl-CoA thioesterase-1
MKSRRASVARTLLLVLSCSACGSEPRARSGDSSAASAASAAPATSAAPAIVFLGTSLTAGYGLSEDQAYPALIQQKLDSAGHPFRVVNAGVRGETSAGGRRRLDWLLRQPVAALVLELGANDGLRGQDIDSMRANLRAIIERTRAAHPDAAILIAGMESPPNMGDAYTTQFRAVFPDLARETGAVLIPFLLEGVAGERELNQTDGIHPTAEGQRIVAATVWRYLKPALGRADSR